MRLLILCLQLLPFVIIGQKYLPKSKGEIVTHQTITLGYSEKHEQAEWVYYESSSALANGTHKRKNDFRPDHKVSTISASLSDYSGSGYDRGHLAPAQDMKATAKIMSESFYLSNMSPQLPAFNRGGNWRKLENTIHQWARKNVIVVTGPIFTYNMGFIGANHVTIPSAFYKVVYWPSKKKILGFMISHKSNVRSLQDCVVAVDEIERLTDIDFFPQLEKNLEDSIEASVSIKGWDFKIRSDSTKKTIPTSPTNTKQCFGITQKGTQCKRNGITGTKYCYQHKKSVKN